jgi:nucleoside-diphosphate-sugar epimerase
VGVLDAAPGLFHDELAGLGARITLGSVTDPALVDRLTAGTDVVFHLAAAFRQINLPKRAYWEINCQGTRHVAEACLRHHVRRLVYCSTQGVHGHVSRVPGDESSPIAPEDYYQQTKYEGELALWEVARQGLEATVIRPMGIYGPGDPGRFLMLFRAVRRGRFLMFGDGEVFYHPCYIDNLVDAFELAAEHPKAVGETYLIGDDRYVSLNELVRETGRALGLEVRITYLPYRPLWLACAAVEGVCRPLGIEPPLFRRRAEWFRQTRAFSVDKARRELGFEPRVPLAEGLRQTAVWYREHGYL